MPRVLRDRSNQKLLKLYWYVFWYVYIKNFYFYFIINNLHVSLAERESA